MSRSVQSPHNHHNWKTIWYFGCGRQTVWNSIVSQLSHKFVQEGWTAQLNHLVWESAQQSLLLWTQHLGLDSRWLADKHIPHHWNIMIVLCCPEKKDATNTFLAFKCWDKDKERFDQQPEHKSFMTSWRSCGKLHGAALTLTQPSFLDHVISDRSHLWRKVDLPKASSKTKGCEIASWGLQRDRFRTWEMKDPGFQLLTFLPQV
jgi:hypothetical protein